MFFDEGETLMGAGMVKVGGGDTNVSEKLP